MQGEVVVVSFLVVTQSKKNPVAIFKQANGNSPPHPPPPCSCVLSYTHVTHKHQGFIEVISGHYMWTLVANKLDD